MKRSNSYHPQFYPLIILLSLSLIYIHPSLAFAENEASLDNHAENTLIINKKELPSSLDKEPGPDSTATKDLPDREDQKKAEVKAEDSLNVNLLSSEAPIRASDPGVKLNIDAALNQEQADLNVPEMTIVINKHVVNHITYFQTRIKDKFTLWLSRSGLYIPMMRQVLREYALPEDLVYISLIESGFNPNAYSRAKAAGTWQFIKSTGKKYGLRIDDWVDERRHPAKSTVAAARYLKDLFEMFGDWDLAMASYNAGEGRIQRALLKTKGGDFWDLVDTKHIKRETKAYVPKFMAATLIAKNPERYGFEVEYKNPMPYDEVTVDSPTDLAIIARASEVPLEEIKALNPHLKRNMTPPGEKEFVIHIPSGKGEIFYKNFNSIPREERLKTQRYKAKKGETLATISRKQGIPVDVLCAINGFSKDKVLKEGDYITLAPVLAIPRKRLEYASIEKGNSPNPRTGNNDDLIYRVSKGDTLWDISKKFNIPVGQIKKWNSIGRGNIIKSGDKLILRTDGATA